METNTSKHLLEVNDLAVSFTTYAGEVQAVRGISFHLDKGETLAIVGESGCGKSVSMQTIMRLLPSPPSFVKRGEVLYEGDDLLKKSDKEMEKSRGNTFSMIFQDSMTSLNPTMRVGRQLVEGILRHQKISRAEAKDKAIDMLRRAGLPNPEKIYTRYPHTLSGGQRQRVMIAMAVASDPKILFADEPTTALDVTMQAQILDILNDWKAKNGMAIVIVTHDLGVVARMADRIAVMYAGKIVEEGDAREVFYNPKHPYTWGLLGAMPDMSKSKKIELYSIPGAPPDLFAPPEGCAFAGRCAYCMGACMKADPEKTLIPPMEGAAGTPHYARCWLLDDNAPKVEPPKDNIPEPMN